MPDIHADVWQHPETDRLSPSSLAQLLGLLVYLDRASPDAVPVAELAREFGVSAAQIIKDIDTLWVTGADPNNNTTFIDFDAFAYEEGLIRLVHSQGAGQPLPLSAMERALLALGVQYLINELGPLLGQDVLKMLNTTLEQLKDQSQTLLEPIQVVQTAKVDPVIGRIVHEAITQQRCLSVMYVNATDERTTRVLQPISTQYSEPNTYVLATSLDEPQVVKKYRIDRFLEAELLPQKQDLSDLEVALAKFHKEQDNRKRGLEVWVEVGSSARWILEQLQGVKLTTNSRGNLEATFKVLQIEWFQRFLRSLGGSLLQVNPTSEMAVVGQEAQDALAGYSYLQEAGF